MKRVENGLMRTAILDATIACKMDASGADVSLSQISYRAGISERTLNRYFPDKEMLIYEAALKQLEGMYSSFAERYMAADISGMNGLQRLLLLIRMQIENNTRDITCAKIFVRAYTTVLRTAVYRDLPLAGYDALIRDIVFRCIDDGLKDGSIRNDIRPLDVYLLISSNYMGLVQHLIYFYSVDFSEEAHKQEILIVFNKYHDMLEKYLRAE